MYRISGDANIEVLAPFLEYPARKFHIRELARLLKLNPMTVRKYLIRFYKSKLILEEKGKAKVKNYYANLGSTKFREYKKFYTIMKILDSGLMDFFNEEFLYPAVILFGSCAKGEDSENSDMDIFLLSDTKKDVDLGRFEKFINRKIQLFAMSNEEFRKARGQNKELINNILNGIRLSGFLKVL